MSLPPDRPSPLLTFQRGDSIFGSATLVEARLSNARYDFISVVSVAQRCQVPFLPITWQPALEALGQGATARVNQSSIDVRTSFAFKRLCFSATHAARVQDELSAKFRALVSEVLILRNPSIRVHPNVVDLEGICWEIGSEGAQISPVLVFKKAPLGDLQTFMSSEHGRTASINTRTQLCSDIAKALLVMHTCDIIHGDIKPQNILVFRDDGGSLLAKVADFGYSCLGTGDNDVVRLPTSWPWVAPEWHPRGFYVQAAKKMDVYSFGMLCFWILFKETLLGYSLDSTKAGGGNAPITFTVPHGYDIEQTKLENLKKEDGLMEIAHELISGTKSLSTEQQITLKTFFDSTLCRDQNAREADVGKLMSLLNLEMVAITPREDNDIRDLPHADFRVAKSIAQLFLADYRVRSHLAMSLKARISDDAHLGCCDDCLRNDAFQLAVCYMIGFGVARDESVSRTWLERSTRQYKELENEVDLVRRGVLNSGFQGGEFGRLLDEGHILPFDFVQYYREQEQLHLIELEYKREISDMEASLGAAHLVTLGLKIILASVLGDAGFLKEAEELFLQVMEARKQAFPEGHKLRLSAMSRLVSIYTAQGQLKEAEALQVQVVEGRLKELGQEHPHTIQSTGIIASIMFKQGRLKEAEGLYARNLGTTRKAFGQEHSYTLTCAGNLATIYRAQGRWKEAQELELQVSQASKNAFGKESRNTLKRTSNLAMTLLKQERWKEAEGLFSQVTETKKTVFGPDHPSTLVSMGGLASAFLNQGRWKEAEQLGVLIVESRKRALGPEHPDTLTSMANLSLAYRYQGYRSKAAEMESHVLETRIGLLGEEHPSTITSMNNFADTLMSQGREREAVELMKRAARLSAKVLGPDHRNTRDSERALREWGVL